MKIKALLTFLSLILFCPTVSIFAQAMPKAAICKVEQVGQTVEFGVHAPETFYVGNNIYILHIGKKLFSHSRQEDSEGNSNIIFLITAAEYKTLAEGQKIYISYGNIFPENTGEELQLACEQLPNSYKYLGIFSKKLLK